MSSKLSQPLLQDEGKAPTPSETNTNTNTNTDTNTDPDHDNDECGAIGIIPMCFNLATAQLLLLVLFAVCTDYGSDEKDDDVMIYFFERDVSIMIFVGFGYLMTFLKKHGYSAIGYTMLVSCFAIQWTILVFGFVQRLHSNHWNKIPIDMFMLSQGQFGAAVVMITFGALIGKVSADQMTAIAFVEIIFYGLNIFIGQFVIGAIDVGGSIFIHTFGAYFGLACSYMMSPSPKDLSYDDNSNNYLSDLFSFIGCVFLWILWPSFNACVADPSQHDVILTNTFLSLVASAVSTFYASREFRKTTTRGLRFEAVDIQNATLAGGVAVGAASNLQLTPAGAIAVGSVAGFVSCGGYVWLQDYLEQRLGLQDTCGVHNLHGMPGLLGSFVTVIACAAKVDYASPDDNPLYPSKQWQLQLAATAITLAISLVSGGVTGWVLTHYTTTVPGLFTDEVDWTVPTAALAFTSSDLSKTISYVRPARQRAFIARQHWRMIKDSLSNYAKSGPSMAAISKIIVAKKRVARAKRGSIF